MRRQIAAVMLATAAAQAAGFLKLWLVARIFGVGAALDGYNLALTLPTFIAGVVAGGLQTGLFPGRARLARTSGAEAAERFDRSVLLVLLVLGAGIAIVCMVLRHQIVTLIAPHSAPAVRDSMAFVLTFSLWLIPLNALGDGLGYLLAVRDRYPLAAAAPIANALLAAGLLAAWPEGGLLNLALGTVLGVALQVALCALALARVGFAVFGALPRLRESAAEWRAMLKLAGWVLPGVLFFNLTATLPIAVMSRFGEGAVSAFGYAWRFHALTVQLLLMAASPIILARFSDAVATGDEAKIRGILYRALVLSVLLGVCAVIGVWLLGVPILTFVFGGRFDAAAAHAVAGYWLWLSVALAPSLMAIVFTKLWQARARARLISALAGLAFAVFVTCIWLLQGPLGSQAVAASVAASQFAIVIAGWRWAWRVARSGVHGAADGREGVPDSQIGGRL